MLTDRIKTLLTLISIMIFAISCSNKEANEDETNTQPKGAAIEFAELDFDFGKLEMGSDAIHQFDFKNTGKESLVLSNVKTSCGCTVPVWPRDPIKPGEKKSIKVKYSTKNPGNFKKTITVTSNAETPVVVLSIKGSVSKAPLE